MTRIAGWMAPSGKFYECGYYKHLEKIAETPELNALAPSVDEDLRRIKAVGDSCQANVDNGGCPCWHYYEMAADGASGTARRDLLDAGCLRVCNMGRELHFEGIPNPTTRQAAKDLAEENGMTAYFESVK